MEEWRGERQRQRKGEGEKGEGREGEGGRECGRVGGLMHANEQRNWLKIGIRKKA